MLIDLHAHYPMHLIPDEAGTASRRIRDWAKLRWQARLIDLISRVFNYQGPGDEPGVTVALMRAGGVGAILSVLYQPLDEIDFTQPYGSPPRESYFDDLVSVLQMVENHVAERPDYLAVAHSPEELATLFGREQIVVIHAVEGGFHLGGEPAEVRRHVAELADRGVVYVTLAHLFWRAIATNANALPFLPDRVYRFLFHQPDLGLSPLGKAAAEAMIEHGILIDITHMTARSIEDVFDLLDERDAAKRVPVIASHMACRFGGLEYALSDETIERVAQRGGLLGCILCEHFITSGLRGRKPRSAAASIEALCTHIDHIAEVAGGFDNVAIGSDLDGYIKPALPGLEHMGLMRALQDGLAERYGTETAEKITHANALRVLRTAWRQPLLA